MQKVDDIEKKFLTRDEAALFLGLRPQTLANLTWQNAGPPYVRLSSRCLRYDRAELLAWMKAREVRPGVQTAYDSIGATPSEAWFALHQRKGTGQ